MWQSAVIKPHFWPSMKWIQLHFNMKLFCSVSGWTKTWINSSWEAVIDFRNELCTFVGFFAAELSYVLCFCLFVCLFVFVFWMCVCVCVCVCRSVVSISVFFEPGKCVLLSYGSNPHNKNSRMWCPAKGLDLPINHDQGGMETAGHPLAGPA